MVVRYKWPQLSGVLVKIKDVVLNLGVRLGTEYGNLYSHLRNYHKSYLIITLMGSNRIVVW